MSAEPRDRSARRAGVWRQALREGVVIVASVLAALAGQAWWQWRDDREHERYYLQQLLSDTRENERRLDAAIAGDSAAGASARRVVAALYGAGPRPSADTLVRWFRGDVFASSAFLPLSGTYGALVAGNQLQLIRTDALRTRIVAYASRLEREREALQFFLAQEAGDPARIARVLPFMSGVFMGDEAPRGAADVDVERLRRDGELRGILFAVQVANANRLTHLRGLRDETRQLRAALERESDRR